MSLRKLLGLAAATPRLLGLAASTPRLLGLATMAPRLLVLAALTPLLPACGLGPGHPVPAQLDGPVTVIANGSVIDGTGKAAQFGHLLVHDDRIVAVAYGRLPRGWDTAQRFIDATGMVVTPGFIDSHSHGNPLSTPEFRNFLAMGVTTINLGQCGSSSRAADMAEWMRSVDEVELGPNVITYMGHGTLRREAGVGIEPEPTPEQLALMEALVDTALAAGAFGLSTALEYQPGSFAGMDELAAVARPLARHGAVVMSHLRNEDDPVLPASIEELVQQGRGSGAPVHIAHIKSVYGQGADRAEEILAALEAARREGVTITADIYPYTASFTGLSILFPDWARPPHDYQQVVATRYDELARYLFDRVALRNGPEATLFGTGADAGKTLAQVAAEHGVSYERVLIDKGPGGGSAAYFVMDEELQRRLLLDSAVAIGSDGSPTMRHPRGHGSHARVIRKYVVEEELLSLEEAVRKMTELPAQITGLIHIGRGRLAEGFAADILIFDPLQVRDMAGFDDPHQPARGFHTVMVNGRVVREAEEFTGERAGRMLRAPWARS